MNEPTNSSKPSDSDQQLWERELIAKLAMSALTEQRKQRRWGMFFKLAFLVYLFVALYAFSGSVKLDNASKSGRYTAVVTLNGVIAAGEEASADRVIAGLQDAFEDSNTAGVILRINSPGGSPVQAGMIYDEIKRLKALHPETPLYAVVADVCASGGYYVAAAADKIYADKASVVGSIGVRMDSFGFVDTMKLLGVERRLLTAGANKGMLDPFLPRDAEQEQYARDMLAGIHQQFIQAVREGRGERLKEDEDTFSGLIWTGEQGLANGLVDGLASPEQVAREFIGEENMVDFSNKKDWLQRVTDRLAASISRELRTELLTWQWR